MPDYKKIYKRIEATYPGIALKMNPAPALADYTSLPRARQCFSEISGFSTADMEKNNNNARLIFIAVVILMADPLYFEYENRAPHRLEHNLAVLFCCSRTQILHNFKNVKSFWHVYPDFRQKVQHFYSQIKSQYERKSICSNTIS